MCWMDVNVRFMLLTRLQNCKGRGGRDMTDNEIFARKDTIRELIYNYISEKEKG